MVIIILVFGISSLLTCRALLRFHLQARRSGMSKRTSFCCLDLGGASYPASSLGVCGNRLSGSATAPHYARFSPGKDVGRTKVKFTTDLQEWRKALRSSRNISLDSRATLPDMRSGLLWIQKRLQFYVCNFDGLHDFLVYDYYLHKHVGTITDTR